MDTSSHNLSNLFAQLGLANTEQDITAFIKQHKGLADDISLANADFWNRAQSSFIAQSIEEDADWAEVVDTLDALLRD